MSKRLKIILFVVLTIGVLFGALIFEGSRRMESAVQRASTAAYDCEVALGDTATEAARSDCRAAVRFAENNQAGALVDSIPFALGCVALLWVLLGIGWFVLGRSRRGKDLREA